MRAWSLVLAALMVASAVVPLGATALVNRPATARAGIDQIVDQSPFPTFNEDTSVRVLLHGNESFDPDDPSGESFKVIWELVGSSLGAPPLLRGLKTVDERVADFYAPYLQANDSPTVWYEFQAFADDRSPATDDGTCSSSLVHVGLYYPAQMCDVVRVTVRNTNQAPVVPSGKLKITPDSVDLLDNKHGTISFRFGSLATSGTGDPCADAKEKSVAGGIKDDIGILSVQLILTHQNGVDRIVLPMQLDGTICDFPKWTAWSATLPVDTPALVSDASGSVTWTVDAEVLDHNGGRFRTGVGEDNDPAGEFTVEVDASSISEFYAFNVGTTIKPQPSTCYSTGTRLAPQALGAGQVLRPEFFFKDAEEPSRIEGADSLLLLWKVTYQSCITSGRFPSLGPEVELRTPYHLNLDTLFSGDQEVKIRFYDRMGGVFQYVVPITKDVKRPLFFVDAPTTTYQNVPFPFLVYVQDRIDTSLRLEVKDLQYVNQTLDNKTMDYEKVVTSTQRDYDANARMFFMPPLSQTVAYDIDNDKVCEVLFDTDSNGRLDTAWNVPRFELTPLVADRARPPSYVVDTNHDGRNTAGELVLVGNATTVIELEGRSPCGLPFSLAEQAFLLQATNQVYMFNLTRDVLGATDWRVTIRDTVFNQVAQNYVFDYGLDSVPQKLTGVLTTKPAETDAKIVSVTTPKGPFLPGDPIELNVTVRHDAPQIPDLNLSLVLSIDEPDAPRFGFTTVTTDGMRSGNDTQVPLKAAPRDPGVHKLRFNVTVPTKFMETARADNVRNDVIVEVYLGAVSDGPWATGKHYFIRADDRGLPVLAGGAVEIGADDKVVGSHDLTFKQDDRGPYYQFTAKNKAGESVTLHWDPLARYSKTFNKDCTKLTAAEKVVNLTADPVQDPKCRPITVLLGTTAGEANASPGVGLVLLLLLVGFAGLRRRKA